MRSLTINDPDPRCGVLAPGLATRTQTPPSYAGAAGAVRNDADLVANVEPLLLPKMEWGDPVNNVEHVPSAPPAKPAASLTQLLANDELYSVEPLVVPPMIWGKPAPQRAAGPTTGAAASGRQQPQLAANGDSADVSPLVLPRMFG